MENVELQLGQILKIDLTLTVASLAESVQVVAESPIIDVKQNAATATINAEVIERIPKGRDFTDLIRAAPGTQVEAKSGIQIDGAGGSEHRYVIDGMDTTGIRTGVSGQELPPDFVQEVQVKSSGYNAEFRATTGGVVSAITKSGSNVFHGMAGAYFRNDSMQGFQRPTPAAEPLGSDEGRVHHGARGRLLPAPSRRSTSAARSSGTGCGSTSAMRPTSRTRPAR